MPAAAEEGWVSNEIAQEFPGLGLLYLPAVRGDHRDAAAARERLGDLEEYFSGSFVTGLQARPLTAAYRVFFRQIGLDPDRDFTPLEWIARKRLARGRFRSRGLLHDALTITSVETEVPIMAVRASAVVGPLGITTARPGEEIDGPLQEGALVIADAARPITTLFGDPDEHARARADERDVEVVLYATVVPGVAPAIAAEALWRASELLGSDRG